jgi:p-aminobenzoyl-glutamate transporter AbgT
MNVDTFKNNPSLKYYFITVVPFMLLILLAWFVFKQFLRVNPQLLPYAGIYERFYDEIAIINPKLWSRNSLREYIKPRGRVAKIK